MPCHDSRTDEDNFRRQRELSQRNAMLCAVLRGLGERNLTEHVLGAIDWSRAGVSRKELNDWWAAHLRLDDQRRKYERERQEKDRLKAEAMKKLSPAEKKALGL